MRRLGTARFFVFSGVCSLLLGSLALLDSAESQAARHHRRHKRQPAAAEPAPAPSVAPLVGDIQFDHAEDGTIYFKATNGRPTPNPVKAGLYDVQYIGPLLSSDSSDPEKAYFLFSAKPCKSCAQDSEIFAVRASGGKPTGYVYPGRIVDPRSHSLVVFEARAFYGRCLYREQGPVYVAFQKERVDRRHGMQSSVFVATPGDDHMDERLIERRLPRLQDTLKMVKAKRCQEITGRNRNALKKPLDLLLRPGTEDDDDDDKDDDGAGSPSTKGEAPKGAQSVQNEKNRRAIARIAKLVGTP